MSAKLNYQTTWQDWFGVVPGQRKSGEKQLGGGSENRRELWQPPKGACNIQKVNRIRSLKKMLRPEILT